MGNSAKENSAYKRYISQFSDMLLLTVLWIVCSIPIITMGASTTAVYYVCLKIIKGEEVNVKEAFFKSYTQNMNQSTIVWVMFAVFTVFLTLNVNYLFVISTDSNIVLKVLMVIVAVIYICAFTYTLPLISRYENSLKKTLQNSAMVALKYFDRTIKIVILYGIIVAIGFYSLAAAIVVFILFHTTICYIVTTYMVKIYEDLEQFIVTPEEGEDNEVVAIEESMDNKEDNDTEEN